MCENSAPRNPLKRREWASLFDIQAPKQNKDPAADKVCAGDATVPTLPSKPEKLPQTHGLTAQEHILALNIVVDLVELFRDRKKGTGMGVRELEGAKLGLLNKGLIKEVWLGKVLLLAPTAELYAILDMPSPYKRNVWDMHSFLILIAAKLIETNPLVKYTKTEVSLGDSSSTVDLIAYLKDGNRWACEVIHKSITNISANAAKLQNKGFSQVIFLCADFNIKGRVLAKIRNAGFSPDFLSIVRYQIFSALMRQDRERRFGGQI